MPHSKSQRGIMLASLSSKRNYANVVATLALFVALGGVSYAASTLPRNSVGAPQLRRNAVITSKLKDRSVTSAKIARNAVTGYQVAESTLGVVPNAGHAIEADHARAADSAKTADSATSATTATSAASASQANQANALATLDFESATVAIPANNFPSLPAYVTSTCPTGLYPTGGGARVSNEADAYVNDSAPFGRVGWYATAFTNGGNAATLTVYVICAPVTTTTPKLGP
jgi:hypothetical protein